MEARIVLLPGDGIGPEVVNAARQALETLAGVFGHRFHFEEHLIGGCALDQEGDPLPPATLQACRRADAVLLGAVGGPRWADPQAARRPEQGLLALRKGLGLFANLRPVRPFPQLLEASPLRPERLQGVDLLIVRELTGGIYFGQPRGRDRSGGEEQAFDTMRYGESEIRRVARLAFSLARDRRRKVTSVDKANVLETSRLWHQVVETVAAEFPQVTLEHQLVDSAAMRLILDPASMDVLLTANLFGDILSDEAAVLTGSIGMLPSASLGEAGPGLYEPIHGSAPDIAGQGLANPCGTILSAAMLLRHSLGLAAEADALEAAVAAAVAAGARTRDLGGTLTTSAMTSAICKGIRPRSAG